MSGISQCAVKHHERKCELVIVGIGIDATSISRVQNTINQSQNFARQLGVLNDQKPFENISNFSIIEAFFKSLGCPTDFNPRDIAIERVNGAPTLKFSGSIKEKMKDTSIYISVTHLNDMVISVVIIEK
jgi:phosphopantetheine--protein transferase-like protein